ILSKIVIRRAATRQVVRHNGISDIVLSIQVISAGFGIPRLPANASSGALLTFAATSNLDAQFESAANATPKITLKTNAITATRHHANQVNQDLHSSSRFITFTGLGGEANGCPSADDEDAVDDAPADPDDAPADPNDAPADPNDAPADPDDA